MAQRMLQGMKIHTETLATGFYEGVNFKGGDFLKQRITMQLFQKEQHMPGKVIDRELDARLEGIRFDGYLHPRQNPCAGNPRLVQAP